MNLAIRALLRSCRHRVIQYPLMGSKSPTQGIVMATMCRSWLSPHRHINGPNGLTEGRMAITGGLGGHTLNTLRPRQNGRYFTGDAFKCIFLKENVWILLKISLKFVPKGPINNIPSLVQIMAWRRPGDKPLSEPMMVSLLMHICVARPQWVNIVKEGG